LAGKEVSLPGDWQGNCRAGFRTALRRHASFSRLSQFGNLLLLCNPALRRIGREGDGDEVDHHGGRLCGVPDCIARRAAADPVELQWWHAMTSVNADRVNKIAADLGLIDTYPGLVLPLIASATATLLFRQFFLTIPDEIVEAGRIDGAGPLRFPVHMVVPLSRTNIAALFVILFIYGWNQCLWPLLVTNTPAMTTIVIGIRQMIGNGDAQTAWHLVMATAILALPPPIAVVLAMQRWFVQRLIEPEK
jgi:hypothetical protein